MKISTELSAHNKIAEKIFFYFCFSPLLAKINAFTIATDDDDDDVHTILLRVGIDWR